MFLQRITLEKCILRWRHIRLYACMFRHETGQLCEGANTKKERSPHEPTIFSLIRKINVSLQRNADLASKPCLLQHFGFPPFSSISPKYCKVCKFQNKGDYKMLKRRGIVPGSVTLLFDGMFSIVCCLLTLCFFFRLFGWLVLSFF